jgi:hypothetical protein
MMLCIKNNCTLINRYVYFCQRVLELVKTFTLKFIIQGLLRLYSRNISFDLTKTKALLMASIGKIVFNIDSLTIHSTLNIPIQQSLYNLPNLLYSLNRFIC